MSDSNPPDAFFTTPRHREGWRRLGRWTVLALVLLALDAAWAAAAVKGHLQTARNDLVAAGDLLAAGKLDEAAAHLADARSAAHSAGNFGLHPSVWIAGHLPFVSDDIGALKALSDSAELAAGAGETVVGAVRGAGWSGSGLPGFSGSSALADPQLTGIAPELGQAASTLTRAEQLLEGVRTDGLIGPIRDAVVTARGKLSGNAKLLGNATDIAKLLPELLTNGKRYLLIGQNLDEPRGTGGFIGFYGFLRIKNGRMNLERFVSATEFTAPKPVGLPVDVTTEYRKRWQDLYALTDVRQANYEPDLPTTGDVLLQFAKAYGWGKFDGIIMVDQVWMSYMLEVAGPIQTPEWPQSISASNALEVLGHDVFFVKDLNGDGSNIDESNATQGAIAGALWTAIETRDLSPAPFAEAISRSVAERHLQLYAADPQVESLITSLGAAGDTTLGMNPIYVTWSELSTGKLASLQDRRVDIDVKIDNQGTATVTTTLHDVNNSAAGPPGEFYGPGGDFPVGAFACYASVYLPEEIEGYPSFVAPGGVTGLQQDQGRPVAIGLVNAPPGGKTSFAVTYTAPGAVTIVGDVKEYRLDFLPQPTVVPIPLSVTVHLPDGTEVTSSSPGMTVDGSTITYEGSPVTGQSYWVRYN